MSEPGSKAGPPAEQEGSAVWALLVGGAILVIAALLIFWPSGETAQNRSGKGGATGSQSALAQGGPNGEGGGLGVAAREFDPNRGGGGGARINPVLRPQGRAANTLAPPRKPKPEPTSFPTASAEIAYWEKKLTLARNDLAQRTMFWERMQKVKEDARTSEQIDNAERRGKIVEKNYLDAKKAVEDLEKKVEGLKEKQRQSGNP